MYWHLGHCHWIPDCHIVVATILNRSNCHVLSSNILSGKFDGSYIMLTHEICVCNSINLRVRIGAEVFHCSVYLRWMSIYKSWIALLTRPGDAGNISSPALQILYTNNLSSMPTICCEKFIGEDDFSVLNLFDSWTERGDIEKWHQMLSLKSFSSYPKCGYWLGRKKTFYQYEHKIPKALNI